MAERRRYPSVRVDLTGLGSRPLLEGWALVREERGDGAVVVGRAYGVAGHLDGTIITSRPVQAIDPEAGWAWTYGMGLVRLGECLDPEGAAAVKL